MPRHSLSFPHSASSIARLTTNNHAEVCTLSRRDDVAIPIPAITARHSLSPLSHICTSVGSLLRLTYPLWITPHTGGVQTYPVPHKQLTSDLGPTHPPAVPWSVWRCKIDRQPDCLPFWHGSSASVSQSFVTMVQ